MNQLLKTMKLFVASLELWKYYEYTVYAICNIGLVINIQKVGQKFEYILN